MGVIMSADSLPDIYRNFVLPGLGVVEAIATRGRSPGTAAMGQIQAYDKSRGDQEAKERQDRLDAQAATREALQNRLGTLQADNLEAESLRNKQKNAVLDAISQRAGTALKNRQDTSMAPGQESNAFQFGGEFKGQSPAAVQAVQVDPEKSLFEILSNEQKAPLTQSEIYRNLHSADAATARVDKMTDKSGWTQPIPAGAIKPKDVVNEEEKINKDYEKETSSSRAGVNLLSADLAYKGIQKTLDAKEISAADVLAIRDQLVKMVNPGYQITQVQFGHSNVGGIADKLDNIVKGMQGDHMLTPHQKTQYKAMVARLASDLVDTHNSIKKTYLDRARQASTRLNLAGDDTLKVAFRPLFDGAEAPSAVTEADINKMSADQLKAFLNGH
jgi:hypothetical protein